MGTHPTESVLKSVYLLGRDFCLKVHTFVVNIRSTRMAWVENLLTAKQIEVALRKGIPTQLNDGGGLFFNVKEKNKGTWFMRGRLNGVAKRRVLGNEKMSLAEARALRNKEKQALKGGIDSVAERKTRMKRIEEEQRTFGMVSDEWMTFWKNDKDEKTVQSTIGRVNKHILPALGKRGYARLTFADLKAVCSPIAESGRREMASRVATIISQICRFAKMNGYHKYNIAEDLTTLFPKPKRDVNFEGFPAITDKEGVADMLRKLEKYIQAGRCSPYMSAALRLFPLLPLRATSMLTARWDDVNLDDGIWRIPAESMKGNIGQRKDFLIPLSAQASIILKELCDFRVNSWLFPSGGKTGHLGVEGVNCSLHRAGIPKGKMCVHGWRKVWGSLAREYGLPDKIVERGVAHSSGSAVEQAYNRAQYREVMRYAFQWWADVLDSLRDGKEIPRLSLSSDMLFS